VSLPRALAIVGPTASGKSRLAVWLAERLGLPVLCCDSVQVYRGLDIGSAKPGPELRARVPHKLIDLVAPDAEFSAGDYAAAAHVELARGPGLFAGGTGFYLRAVGWTHSGGDVADAERGAQRSGAIAATHREDVADASARGAAGEAGRAAGTSGGATGEAGREAAGTSGGAADEVGREAGTRGGEVARGGGPVAEAGRAEFTARWEAAERAAPGAVHAALSRVDPETARAIHPRNVVRALRALWLCEAHGQPVSRVREVDPSRPRARLGLIVLEPAVDALDRAIDARCDAMMRAGFLAEVEMLRRAGYDARHKSMRSLGYRQLLEHLEGHLSLADAVAAIKLATRHYARRQRTYFRHQLAAHDVSGASGAVALRIAVAAPLWEPALDLSRETGAWLPRVEQFIGSIAGASS